jgi:Ras-related protein Rab-1A
VDFEIKQVVADGNTVNLQIWDTAGQERFRTITTSYYRSSDAILLVFDVSDSNTFKNLDSWLEDIRLYARENVDIMLIGNKVDLESSRATEFQEAKEFAERNNMLYVETSAKNHVNVDQAFTQITIAACATKNALAKRRQSSTNALSATGNEQKGGCC